MLGAEVDDSGWLVHAPVDVPDVEVLCRVHHEEFAKSVHKARRSSHPLRVFRSVIVNCAPIDLHDWQFARVAPDSNGRSVGVVVDAKQVKRSQQ